MRVNGKFVVAVALLAVLAVMFGLAGTIAPPLAEEVKPSESSSSSSSSVAHFQNPPTYNSGWVDIRSKCGQYFSLEHNLNTTDVIVDITGKQSLDPMGGALAWSKTYGGTGDDYAYSLVQTGDGGYILAGYTNSSGDGIYHFWLVKTDSTGSMQWSKTYGTQGEYAESVVQTNDGGYALAGYTYSYSTAEDIWLVKTDSAGNMLWNKTYGGPSTEYVRSMVQTSDGGYALAGETNAHGGSVGYTDFWLVKTDPSGNMLWNKQYGNGTSYDFAESVVQTNDGGYALAGIAGYDSGDFWLVKTDSAGNMLWNKTYGGTRADSAYSVVQTSDGGYALAGKTLPYGAWGWDFWLVKTDSTGTMQWNKTYGGDIHDQALSVVQTNDGGYALAGGTDSFGGTPAYWDFWLVRTDSAGNMLWNKTYGGTQGDDYAYSLVQTGDGGYALAGLTNSYGAGGYDFWLVKVKPEMNLEHQRHLGGTGVISGWTRTYGGANFDWANSVVQTADGGIALAGYTDSFGAGSYDFWLVKTDASGTMQWSRTYGGTGIDEAYSLVQTSDGGYALAGYTSSYGAGNWDFWLVKTDSDGNALWNKTYGGTSLDQAYSLVQTADGGYALLGWTGSGIYHFWLVKTDSAGNHQWNKTYGGASSDYAASVVQTSDGGYALAGQTYSFGAGSGDFWLVKTDSDGNALWNKTYGGASSDYAASVVQTSDGGYALAGQTYSFGAGGNDFWLVKTDSAGNHQWNKTYGGASSDAARSVCQTSDGGYALAGWTFSFGAGSGDFWLVKTDSTGAMQWSKTYGGVKDDRAYSVVQTSDGGYALAGFITSFGAGGYDFLLVKTDVEMGLAMTGLTNTTITLYRGKTDLYWNYVRVRIWTIKEPTWIYGDINMDGVVDAKDLYIIGRNYGKTFSLLSLSGIIAVAGIQTVKTKRKRSKKPSYIS